MNVTVPDATRPDFAEFRRSGVYGEIGHRFGPRGSWKLLGRAGTLQLDDRVIADVTDQTIVGATLLYRPSLIEFSLSASQDLKKVEAKRNYTYLVGRIIIAL
jgi:hypothetical protein